MSIDIKRRFDRIVAIYFQLQSKRIVKAIDLAQKFNVSSRTIYRDIKSLEQAGVPVIGEAGSGYSLIEGYKLPPIIFSPAEALSFVGAEKLVEKYMAPILSSDFNSAMDKIKAVLRTHDKESVATVGEHIIMSKTSTEPFNNEAPDALRIVFESIAQRKQSKIKYKGASDHEAKSRNIEPIGIFHESYFWYIVGYCHERNDYRQFRADRIYKIELLETIYTKEHVSIQNFITQRRSSIAKTKVRIEVEKEIAPFLQWERAHYGFIEEKIKEDSVEMTFQTYDAYQQFARWYLQYAEYSIVLEPKELTIRIQELLTNSLEKLKKSS